MLQAILNTVGLISGMIGAALVFKYGLPSMEVLNEGAYVETEITDEMRRYTRSSRLGLVLIGVGFLFQFVAVWV
jgi:hypothetical protein